MSTSLFDRVTAALFGGGARFPTIRPRSSSSTDMVELVVETVEPRVRMNPGYQRKLSGCVSCCIAHLRSIASEEVEPLLLTRAAWSSDPRVNAFFATADDVPACLGRSTELRAFFENLSNQGVDEAYALLGMKKEERNVLAPKLEGDGLQHDVAQVTVSFSGHRIVAPCATLEATRVEIGRRVFQRLAQVALSRIVAVDMKATELQEHKAYLGARMRLLNLARDGMEGIVKDPATIGDQMKALERDLKHTVNGYVEAKASLSTLDGYIKHIDDVFSHPDQHVSLTRTPLRVTQMGIKADADHQGAVNDLTLAELAIGDDFRAAVAIVRCPRSEVPAKEDLVAKAERSL